MTFYPAGPIEIRDGTRDRIEALGLFKKVFKGRAAPTQDEQLPLAVVWNMGERTQPEGDANTAEPKFFHNLKLAIDVLTSAASEASADLDIVQIVETVRASLLSDKTWVDLFDGIESCDTRYAYPKEAGNILVQAVIEIEVSYRSTWQPLTPNALKEIVVFAEPGRLVTCSYCGTENPAPSAFPNVGSHVCTTCSGPLPEANEPVLTIIKACP